MTWKLGPNTRYDGIRYVNNWWRNPQPGDYITITLKLTPDEVIL
jgi:hypothetical protein